MIYPVLYQIPKSPSKIWGFHLFPSLIFGEIYIISVFVFVFETSLVEFVEG